MMSVEPKTREEALNQIDVPESLMKDQLDAWLASQPIDPLSTWRATSRKMDSDTGIVQLLLPNGAKVNYASTSNESQGKMKVFMPGGKTADGPEDLQAAMVGIETISES